MKVTELKAKGLKKSYKVVMPKEEYAKEFEAKLAQIAKTAKIQGFRAGKAPLAMASICVRPQGSNQHGIR